MNKNSIFILIFAYVFYSFGCNSIQSNSNYCCKSDFFIKGIVDFELGMEKIKIIENFPKIEQSKVLNALNDPREYYNLKLNAIILGKSKEVNYFLTFKNNKLEIVFFEIDIEDDLSYFYNLRDEIISIGKSSYINSKNLKKNGFSFREITEYCDKFFRLKQQNGGKFIMGGIGVVE